jgi:hypothetical protein
MENREKKRFKPAGNNRKVMRLRIGRKVGRKKQAKK